MDLLEQLPPGLLKIIGYLGLLLATCKAVDWVFDQDDVIKKEKRQRVGIWLRNITYADKVEHWPAGFVALFDRWFGEKHLSPKCLLRSFITSTCLIFVLYTMRIAFFDIPFPDPEWYPSSNHGGGFH